MDIQPGQTITINNVSFKVSHIEWGVVTDLINGGIAVNAIDKRVFASLV